MSNYIINETNFNKIVKKIHSNMGNELYDEFANICSVFLNGMEIPAINHEQNNELNKNIENYIKNLEFFERFQKIHEEIEEALNLIIKRKDGNPYLIQTHLREIDHFIYEINIFKSLTSEMAEINKTIHVYCEKLEKKETIMINQDFDWIVFKTEYNYIANKIFVIINRFHAQYKDKKDFHQAWVSKKINNYSNYRKLIKLSKIQEILSQSLGFRNYHAIQNYFKSVDNSLPKTLEQFFQHSTPGELSKFFIDLMPKKTEVTGWEVRANSLLEIVCRIVCDLRDQQEYENIDIMTLQECFMLEKILHFSKRRDIRAEETRDIRYYLNTLPGYEYKNLHQSELVKEQHTYILMNLLPLFQNLKKLEENFIICPFVGETSDHFLIFAEKNEHLWFTGGAVANGKEISSSVYLALVKNFGKRSYTIFDLVILNIYYYWGDAKSFNSMLILEMLKNIDFIKSNNNKFVG